MNNQTNYDDQFIRQITIGLAKTLNKRIRWINRFEDKNIRVTLPMYLSEAGDENFLLDAFIDDIVDKRVSQNTDQFQRGIITFTGFGSKSDEFANPNQYLKQKYTISEKLRTIISKVKAVPININYDIKIQLATHIEIDKVSQKILNLLFNYYYFNIDYFGMKIYAVLTLPDDKGIEIQRELSMESDRKKFINFSLNIETYYPIFAMDIDDLIPCDNDDEIDWNYLEIPKPNNDFNDTVKKYNEAINNVTLKNDETDETDETEGKIIPKKVYWNTVFHFLDINENNV